MAISKGKVGRDLSYPYISVTSWIQTLDNQGKLQRFLGLGDTIRTMATAAPSLEEFWSRYEYMHSGHEVFELARAGKINLKECVPCYLHGDEGTTYKKDGCLCLSFHCPLGRGTVSNKLGPIADEVLDDPHMNFIGHAFETRFLLGAMLRVVWRKQLSDFCFILVWFMHRWFNLPPIKGTSSLKPCFH